MAVTDDDVVKRRLLIDGEGGNDDKRLNNLLRMFIRWTSAPDDEESALTYQRIMSTIGQCEFTMEKSIHVYEMNLREQEHYDQLSRDIEKKIKEATAQISECKTELQMAKRIRKNRQEYDSLAKVIQKHPDRQDTMNVVGSCSHIVGLIIALQQWQLMGFTEVPSQLSCTSLPEQWSVPRGRKIEPVDVPHLIFVNPKPDRKKRPIQNTLTDCRQLQSLDMELTSQAETKQKLEEKLELRRKQFLVLITAIHELQRILEDDEKDEQAEETMETG